MDTTTKCATDSNKKYSIVIENNNNRVTYAEFDKMEAMVSLALELHKLSNISHIIRVMCEDEIIISFYA